MFPNRFFPLRFFPERYWPGGGAEADRAYPTTFLVVESDPAPLVTESDTDEA